MNEISNLVVMTQEEFNQHLQNFADSLLEKVVEKVETIQRPREPETSDFYTVGQVCDIFGISRTTLWKWEKTGYLPAKRWGNKIRFTREAVEAVLNDTKIKNTNS